MGTSTSTRQFAAKFVKAAHAMDDPKPALIAGAETAKQIFRVAAGDSLGAMLTGKRKPVGVKDDFVRNDMVVVTYTGPAHLLNNPTREHFITARRQASRSRAKGLVAGVGAVTAFGGSARGMFGTLGKQSLSRAGNQRGGARSLTIGGEHATYAFHPGTRGKDFFVKAKVLSIKAVPRVVQQKHVTQPLRAIFR